MPTALTVLGVNTASSTLSTAHQLVTSTGGTANTSNTTTINASTGFGELYASGNSAAWAAGSVNTAIAPSGNGFLYDVTTLEGQQIVAGSWVPIPRLSVFTASITADIYVRAYRYNSSTLTYTSIGVCLLSGNTITTTGASFTFAGTSLAAANFGVGDKLYIDIWLNILTNAGSTGEYVRLIQGAGTTGRLLYMEIDTPGYIVSPATTKDAATRLRLLAVRSRDLAGRLLLQFGVTTLKNIGMRLLLTTAPQKNLATRLRLRIFPARDISTRIRIISSTGFFVPLITFTPNTLILPADVNTNFANLNNASIYTGPITHLIADSGQLTSTTVGGLLIGGQMGAIAYSDRIDADSVPGSLVLGSGITGSGGSQTAGTSGAGFVMQVAGTTVGDISSAGFAGAGLTADTSIKFTTGTIVKAIAFVGRDNGVYNHNLGFLPEFFGGMHTVPTNKQVAFSAATSTQVTVTANFVASFICWVVEYS